MSRSRRSRSRSVKNSHQPATYGPFRSGRVTRNPFLNFLRDFRKSNNGLKLTELTKRGAELWRKMNDRQKSPYCQLARQAPKVRRARSRGRRGRRGRRRRKRRRRHAYSTDNEHSSEDDGKNRYSDDEPGKLGRKDLKDQNGNQSNVIDLD